MCCFLGICESVGLVLTTLVLSTLGAYAIKALYLASLQHRDPSLYDAFNAEFWQPSGAAFWLSFVIIALLLLVCWFLLHQLCNCCSVCRRSEKKTPPWWRHMQPEDEPTDEEVAAYRRLEEGSDMDLDSAATPSPPRHRAKIIGHVDNELERYKNPC